jgi:type I restriction-modification system DNA methylase subunit
MTKYESFDILSLADNFELSRFYYILANGQLFLENIPSAIDILLANRIEKEKSITKDFYEYYHFLRELFFYHLKTHNPKIQSLQLLEYAQTIIDRIVFISVVKDYDLLPYNVLKDIEDISTKSWEKDKLELWRQLKKFFIALDEGLPPRIHKFNGGLFRQNKQIDDLVINDVFLKRLLSLNNYDFESDLNVNVLGHIFEQSIADIEHLKRNILENKQIEYVETDDEIDIKLSKAETNKRKKEGIFYTPEIITQYIVKATVGTWLENKKNELGLNEIIDFPKNEQEKKFQINLWEQYKTILKNVKILDPACGSGAFLTQAFDFLLREWQMVLDVINKLKGEKIELRANGLFSSAPTKIQETISQVKKDIVNNNLFGVDLNNESVEITKLGLWLKSASKKDPLALLDSNIKCGNSLISDKTITSKAFIWETEFKDIINNGKFDIIIGNPPYGAEISKSDFDYFCNTYQTASYKLDTYSLFIEKSFELIKTNGYIGLIIPYTWLTIQQHRKLREFMLTKNILQIIDLPVKIFDDADLDTTIAIFNDNNDVNSIQIGEIRENNIQLTDINISKNEILKNKNFSIQIKLNNNDTEIIDKIKAKSVKLDTIFEVSQGYIPYRRSDLIKEFGEEEGNEIVDKRLWHSDKPSTDEFKQEIQGKDIERYFHRESFQYIKYGRHVAGYVDTKFFNNPRVLIMEITRGERYRIKAAFTEKEYYNTPSIINVIHPENDIAKLKILLTLLNSRLFTWYHNKVNPKAQAQTSIPKILVTDVRNLPVIINDNQTELLRLFDLMVDYYDKNSNLSDKFISRLKSNLNLKKVTIEIKEFYKSDFQTLLTELKKQNIKLTLKQQDEWENYFNENKQTINDLLANHNDLNKKIDYLVYKLYDLSQDEIEMIEKQ